MAPGDLVFGDSDGVVVVAAENAEQICTDAAKQCAKENDIMRRIRSGERLTRIFGFE